MITVLIRTVGEDGGRDVRGLVYLDYDPAAMGVIARYPRPDKITELACERVPLLSCVRALRRRHGLPAREIRRALNRGEHLRLEIDPVTKPAASP